MSDVQHLYNSIAVVSFGLLLYGHALAAQQPKAHQTYPLQASPKTIVWGYYSAKATPVLRVKSSDTVEMYTLITSSPQELEAASVAQA